MTKGHAVHTSVRADDPAGVRLARLARTYVGYRVRREPDGTLTITLPARPGWSDLDAMIAVTKLIDAADPAPGYDV